MMRDWRSVRLASIKLNAQLQRETGCFPCSKVGLVLDAG